LLGYYVNFPKLIHRKAIFQTKYTTRTLQKTIIQTLYKLNNYEATFEEIIKHLSAPSVTKCKVNFDFGIAEELTFTYLNEKETRNLEKMIHKKPLQVLDLLCIIRYYKITNDKRKRPLKFDYYLLRFLFREGEAQVLLHHERGIQRVSPQDFLEFIIEQIEHMLAQRKARR